MNVGHYVYFAKISDSANNHYFKVGTTSENPYQRICQLQVGCPFKIYLWKAYFVADICAKELERMIHKNLKVFMVTGEWFSLNSMAEEELKTMFECMKEDEVELSSIRKDDFDIDYFHLQLRSTRRFKQFYGEQNV